MNCYSILGMNRTKFTKEALENRYNIYINELEKEMKKTSDPDKIKKINQMKLELKKAYDILSDDSKREQHDKKLDSGISQNNKEKRFNIEFDKNHILEYNNSLITDISYNRKVEEVDEYFDKKDYRLIKIQEVGNLSYTTSFNIKYNDLKRFNIQVKNILDNEVKSYKVFTSFSKLKLSEDNEYEEFFKRVLLSDENLKTATKYNGGYIGEIQLKDNEFTVVHNQDTLCAAIEFDRRLRGKVNHSEMSEKGKSDNNEIIR